MPVESAVAGTEGSAGAPGDEPSGVTPAAAAAEGTPPAEGSCARSACGSGTAWAASTAFQNHCPAHCPQGRNAMQGTMWHSTLFR